MGEFLTEKAFDKCFDGAIEIAKSYASTPDKAPENIIDVLEKSYESLKTIFSKTVAEGKASYQD